MAADISATEFLKKKKLPDRGFIVIYGPEKFLLERILQKFEKNFGKIQTVYGGDITGEDFIELLGSQNLFTKRKVFLLKEAEKLFTKLRKKEKEKVFNLLKKKTPINLILLYFEQDLKKRDWEKEPYKTLSVIASLKIKLKTLTPQQLKALLKKKFTQAKVKIEDSIIDFLMESFSDPLQLKTEADKILLYALGKEKLSLEEVRNLILGNSQYTVFDFQNAFFQKNLKLTLNIYKSLNQGLNLSETSSLVLQLESLLLSTANKLLLGLELLNKGFQKGIIFNELGIKFAFQRKNYENWFDIWKIDELIKLITNLYHLEINIKLKFLSPEAEFKKFIINSIPE